MTDPISDLIIRIKNSYLARHERLLVPHSKLKHAIAKIMVEAGYLDSVEVVGELPKQQLEIKLRYINSKPAMTDVKRISKPGRRLYSNAKQLPKTLGGYGITVVSTSRGLLTDQAARKQNIGGELICQIW